ncbi:dehydrogenase/reductase SDR family member 4-like isoform X2 [Tachyglossus aculeatus]|uniref:dehydrogenase/reductase SDR family member 4-like isoform X2 n=1 Tax=Tachyglossus aculeatus TaxID=9261 RepID=UPI0018F497BF|nr:dehydrogenase/reductase SDR family member 4-like isoform X2 [Tachyglossus aculeatus]
MTRCSLLTRINRVQTRRGSGGDMRRALGWAGGRLQRPGAPVSARMCHGGGGGDQVDRRVPLAGRVALITGSTDGIGLAVARRLGQDGAHVVLSSRQQENVARAVAALQAEGLSVSGTVCHVGKAEDRERLVAKALEHSGGVDFLVCVAGVNPLVGSTWEASEQIWDKILDVNVKSPALLLGLLVPHMEKRGSSAVVLVSSLAAYIPIPLLGPYNISKTAILGLTKTLALELEPKGIRVNCLAPGIIKTNFSQVLWKNEKMFNQIQNIYQFSRTGKPEDCAGVVSFLCSPDASYITGETIVVAGSSQRL